MQLVQITEEAAIIAGSKQGLGNANQILQSVRTSVENSLLKMNFGIHIKNDRFKEHPIVTPLNSHYHQNNKVQYDLILAAIEGHKTCASGGQNSAAFIALSQKNSFLDLPNLYMYKIAVSSDAYEVVDIEQSVTKNIKRIARFKKKYIENTTICVLNRDRHNLLIAEIRKCGARILLIQDGDISGSLAAATNQGVDMLIGYGGTQEGVLTAAAMKCIGGYLQCKIFYKNGADKKKAAEYKIKNFDKIYEIDDLVSSNEVIFASTGITDGLILKGVHFEKEGAYTYSWLAKSKPKITHKIETKHFFDYKQISQPIL